MDKETLLSTSGLSMDRLANFCRIAEFGSLSKAAGGDPGKQSLYSRQMRELEEFFGVELKRRQGNGFAITEAGRRLAQLTRAHLAGLEDHGPRQGQIDEPPPTHLCRQPDPAVRLMGAGAAALHPRLDLPAR